MMMVSFYESGQGVAVYGSPDDPDNQVERTVIGTALNDLGQLVPIAWDPRTAQYACATDFEGFLGLVFEGEDEIEEDAEEFELE